MAVRQPAIRSSLFTEEPLAHEGVRTRLGRTQETGAVKAFSGLCARPCQPQLSVESAEASCSSTALAITLPRFRRFRAGAFR